MDKLYNNFPEGFKKPTLQKGKRVAFELVDGSYAPVILPLIETIRIDDQLVDIAVVRTQKANGEPELSSIEFDKKVIYLNGDRAKDQKFYTQLMLSNHNVDNENRDPSKRARFRVYDPVGKARKENEKIIQLAKAQAVVADMTEQELKNYFDIKGDSSDASPDILRGRLLKIAQKSPGSFVKNKGLKPEESVLGVFAEASKRDIITFDTGTYEWRWSNTGDAILQIPRRKFKKGETRLSFFVEFLEKEEGRKVYGKLRDLLETE